MKTNKSCVYSNAITYNEHLNTLEPRRTYKNVCYLSEVSKSSESRVVGVTDAVPVFGFESMQTV